MGDQEVRVLQFLLEDGPAWGKEIAEHLGMTEWRQIQSGTYIGNKLAKIGMVERKMMCGDRFAPARAYFIITEAGTAAINGVVGIAGKSV